MHHFRLGRMFRLIVSITLLSASGFVTAQDLPADPLDSVMWENMAQRFFPGEVVIDQRVVVIGPQDAENQMQVPITCLLYTSPSPRDRG